MSTINCPNCNGLEDTDENEDCPVCDAPLLGPKIQRYSLQNLGGYYPMMSIEPDTFGDYVRYEDVIAYLTSTRD